MTSESIPELQAISSVEESKGQITEVINQATSNQMATAKYHSVDELIGKIEGIERTILIDKDNDNLLNIVEKIALIPDNKLVLVEPISIPCEHQ